MFRKSHSRQTTHNSRVRVPFLKIVIALAFLCVFGPLSGHARFLNDSFLIDRSQGAAQPLTLPVILTAPTTNQVTPSSSFTVPLTVSDVTNEDIRSYQFTVFYNTNVITPTGSNAGCSTTGTMSGDVGISAICNVIAPGELRVAAFGFFTSLTGSGTLLNLTFATASGAVPGDNSPLTFAAVAFKKNSTGEELPNTPINGQIHLVGTQTITVTTAPPPSAIYGNTFQVAATGGASGNSVVIATSGGCSGGGNSVAGSPVTITMTSGTVACTITYNQAGGPNHLPAPQVTNTVNAAPRPITVTADAKTKVYGNVDPALTYQITNGNLVGSDGFTGNLTRAAGENVGNYAITQGTLSAGTNYSLTYVGSQLSITARPITVTADAKTKVYGSSDPTLTYLLTSGSLVSGDSFSGSLTRTAGESVASYSILQGTLTAGANYTLTYVSALLTITAKNLTATAIASNKTYDGNTTASATCTLTGVVSGDTVNCIVSSATFDTPDVGTGKTVTVNVGINGSSSANYTVTTPVTTTANITAKNLTATATAANKVYDGNTTASATCALNGVVAGDTVNCGVSSATFDTASVGTGKTVTVNVTISGGSTANYTVTSPTTTTANITARAITVTADPKTKVFGTSDPALTYQLTSGTLVSGDSITGSLTRQAGENVGSYNILQGTVTAGSNYALSFVSALFTISKAPQTITVTTPAPTSAVVNSAFNVAATGGGSGLPVAIVGSGACAGGGNNSATITMTSGTGVCVVTYDQLGNGNYDPAPQVSSNTNAINQASVQFSAASYIEDESQTAAITITRTGDDTITTTVNFATSVGGGTPGTPGACSASADYAPVSQTVTFMPTQTQQTVNVDVCGDTQSELTETALMTLSVPSGGVLGTQQTAVLNLNDTANQFTNAHAPISIVTGGTASPYPSSITVAGAPSVNGGIRLTLYDVTHDSPDNIDILLVGPGGRRIVIMGDAGGTGAINTPVTLTFEDIAGQVLPNNGPLVTGKYEPTTWEGVTTPFAAPAPGFPYSIPGSTVGGTPSFASVFGSGDPNGTWSLYIRDDAGSPFAPLVNTVAGGWGIQFNRPTAAEVSISGRVTTSEGRAIRGATITVTGNSLSEPLIVPMGRLGHYRVDGLTAGEIYVVTVSSRRFTFTLPSRVVHLVDSVDDIDFVAEN